MINILICDDSSTERALLQHIIDAESDMKVVGCAKDGQEAVTLAAKLKPDLITMDIQMPVMNGYEAIRLIMMNNPVPIIVISSTISDKDLNASFLALEAGALSVLEKPAYLNQADFDVARKRMITNIRAMAEIKVVKRHFASSKLTQTALLEPQLGSRQQELIAIGASVGGPQVLKNILSALPLDFPLPIVIVQHIAPGFIKGFCKWLNESCALSVTCIEKETVLKPGTVYFASDQHHLQVKRVNQALVGFLNEGAPVAGFCPSITVLFQSIAETCKEKAIGILLTGMGQDGAEGLLALKQKKAHTLIQDQESSVVFGMAAVAKDLGAVDEILNPEQLISYLRAFR